VLASAIAARTQSMPILIGALLLNFYDPIKLAEDMVVLDIVSNGRVSYVIGLGYRPEEYAMFGIDMAARGKVMDQKLQALRRALAGERFEFEGRAVHVTPAAVTPGGPRLAYGGHSRAAARRAGRLGLDLFAEGGDAPLVEEYCAAAEAAGVQPGNAYVPTRDTATSVFVADDVDQAWRDLGPYLLHDAQIYREWMGDSTAASSRSEATTVDELRAENGPYRILTVDEAVAQVRSGMPLSMQPLCGGIPPELAWKSVRLAGTAVQASLA
jgi:alkanesulfonate monooxygenase SsuD/methylene tetrahydromethanopterin reductase-like flavin-dependent oxidoreductase (luciferase family)